jgi:AmmeMemoRadiSam system protein B
METRQATFAGSWYPGTAAGCQEEIEAFLAQSAMTDSERRYVGGIVPHAGWYFSGQLACQTIARLRGDDPENRAPDVITIFGMHLSPASPCFLLDADQFETPLGPLTINRELVAGLRQRLEDEVDFRLETARDFQPDNTIELQLPFVKYLFPASAIVTVGLPPTETAITVANTLVDLAGAAGLSLKVLGSTDLTHYGANYGFSPRGSGKAAVEWVRQENDRRLIEAIASMDPMAVIGEARSHHNACCAGAVAGAVAAATVLGTGRAETAAYANSFDKSPGDSFVGYVGMLFH